MSALRKVGVFMLAALAAYAAFFAVQTLRPRTLALELPEDLLPGDVVLMRSHTWRAELVRLVDGVPYRDGFSHVGLVHAPTQNGWSLVHAVPGADGTVRTEDWASIARGGGISEAVIYRAELSEAQRGTLVALQADAAARSVAFDSDFDHHDDSALYCTELVTYLYAGAGHPVVSNMVMAKRAVFPGHLAASPQLRRVAATRTGTAD